MKDFELASCLESISHHPKCEGMKMLVAPAEGQIYHKAWEDILNEAADKLRQYRIKKDKEVNDEMSIL